MASGEGCRLAVGRARQPDDRGAAAVEFALVVPVLIALVFGMVEFGRAFSVQATLSHAAREGARALALGSTVAAARTVTRSAAPGIALTDSQIAVSPTTCVGTAAGTNATVTITYQLAFISRRFGTGATITGRGVMRCLG